VPLHITYKNKNIKNVTPRCRDSRSAIELKSMETRYRDFKTKETSYKNTDIAGL